ncbi:Oxidoreductase, FAD/FMN-binding protein [Aphelenchoides bicaudatus]|nr:Oxidoreductase, FAD/FMN-binding protein [Aphelenchoides bicaudatus]
MVKNRVHVDKEADPSILSQKLTFKTSGRVAKNRLLKSALSDRLASYVHLNPKLTGIPSDQLINTYSKFGHGGFGVLITGNASVHPDHLEAVGNLVVCYENETDECRTQFKLLAEVAKCDGSIVIMQLAHPVSKKEDSNGKVLTEKEVQEQVVERFVYAARQAHLFGFDGVQIHAAYVNLLVQFLSPNDNKREDKYGGSVENRFRVIEEIYSGIRNSIPPSTGFIVGIKLDFVSSTEKTQHSPDFIEILKRTDLEVEETTLESTLRQHIKQTKVYMTGGFKQVEMMAKAVESGYADGIGLGRSVTAEPGLAKKILNKEAQSVSQAFYDHDYQTMINMSLTQMAQAGQTSWSNCQNDPAFGITDFSNKQEAENFHKQLKEHLKTVGESKQSVFDYKPL